jgi:hypothetical protein
MGDTARSLRWASLNAIQPYMHNRRLRGHPSSRRVAMRHRARGAPVRIAARRIVVGVRTRMSMEIAPALTAVLVLALLTLTPTVLLVWSARRRAVSPGSKHRAAEV